MHSKDFNTSFQSSKVPLTIQEFNSDEKVEEVNRLINILANRKKISIIVSMLIIYQEKNYPKMLKDYLIECVKDYIDNNPGHVISYNGDPFTRDNCFMGMRVILGKHRVFQKELIDGAEYLHVNLSCTANFLSDEISKICVGPRNNRPIHCSLVDEPKFEYKNHKLIANKANLEKFSFDKMEKNTNNSKKIEKDDSLVGLNDDSDFDINANNLDMRDDDEFSEGQEEKILKNNNNSSNNKGNNIINLGESDEGEQNDEFNFAKPKIQSNNSNNKYENKNNNIINDGNIDEDEVEFKNINESSNYSEAPKFALNASLFSKEFRDIDKKLLQNKSRRNKKDKIKSPLEINKSKYSFQDIITIKNFGKYSPVSTYLNENKESIQKYLELFNLLQNIGQEGQKQFERLEKLNPSNNQDDSKSQISNSENNNNNMEEIFNEFEIKKDNLIRTYKRIQTTVGSISVISNNNDNLDNNLIKDDINYLNLNSKLYNNLLEEMFPLFDSIHSQTQHFSIANITKNLQKISDSLKQNDIGFKNFFVFVQSLINRIPMGAIRGNNLCDILGDEKEDIEVRKKHFYEILNKEKNDLLNSIKPVLDKSNQNNKNDVMIIDDNDDLNLNK